MYLSGHWAIPRVRVSPTGPFEFFSSSIVPKVWDLLILNLVLLKYNNIFRSSAYTLLPVALRISTFILQDGVCQTCWGSYQAHSPEQTQQLTSYIMEAIAPAKIETSLRTLGPGLWGGGERKAGISPKLSLFSIHLYLWKHSISFLSSI